MSTISEILEYNSDFVRHKEYEQYRTDRFPDKRHGHPHLHGHPAAGTATPAQ